MRTFKGFNNNLQATCGKGTFQYQPGVLYREEKSKTRSTGFHAAEYILDCMRCYPLNGKNRFSSVCQEEASMRRKDVPW